MLVFNPDQRIPVEDALKHPYVYKYYNEKDIYTTPHGKFDSSVEKLDPSLEEWKSMLTPKILTCFFI